MYVAPPNTPSAPPLISIPAAISAFCTVRTLSPLFPRTGNEDGSRRVVVLATLTLAFCTGAATGAATGAMRARATAVATSRVPVA